MIKGIFSNVFFVILFIVFIGNSSNFNSNTSDNLFHGFMFGHAALILFILFKSFRKPFNKGNAKKYVIKLVIIPSFIYYLFLFLFSPSGTSFSLINMIYMTLGVTIFLMPTLLLISYENEPFSFRKKLFKEITFIKNIITSKNYNSPMHNPWLAGIIITGIIFFFFDVEEIGTFILGIITLIIFIYAMYVFLSLNTTAPSNVIKNKEDILSSGYVTSKVEKLLNNKENGVWCGRVNGRNLYASIEDRAVVIGPPGTGKTAFMVTQLIDWIKSGRSFVSLDIKPEIFGILRFELEEKGYKVITFNPTSQTGQRYNFITDLDSPEAIGELAGYLIPADDGSNAVFFESARDFLDSILSHLKATINEPTLPDVRDFVTEFDKYEDLLKVLKNSPDNDTRELANGLALTANNERLVGSIFATFRANLRFLRYPAIRNSLSTSEFSLSELGRKKPVALFLQFEEKNKGITEKLLVTFINHMFRYLISHTARSEVLILLDELGNAPRIDGLVEKLNTIRSRHLPTWMYFQSIEQMQMYGKMGGEGASKILGACDYQQVFRLNDNSSAEMMSKAIGVIDREVSSRNVSTSGGFFDSVESVTESKNLVQEPIVFPHELRQLKKNEAIIIYQGLAWCGEATPYFKAYPEYQGIKPAEHEIVDQAYS